MKKHVSDSRGADCLTALLHPVPVHQFLSTYWRVGHLLCRGSAGRFSGLLSWPVLNEMLEHHWRETFRFRLAMEGRDLDPASYVDSSGTTPRIHAQEVTERLRRGATLSFSGVDELHEPLTRLAEVFEAFFEAGTNMNVYAGWRSVHGLEVHRDDQDIFILQLDGRKRWYLYGFTLDGIDTQAADRSVTAGATVDQILDSGDFLYIPKGCYHLAVPMDEPTLHLTISVKSAPKTRPSFSLPWSATADGLPPPGTSFLIRMRLPPPRAIEKGDGAPNQWQSRGRTYRFPRAMPSIIAAMADGTPRTIQEIAELAGEALDAAAVRVLVAMLVRLGLATVI